MITFRAHTGGGGDRSDYTFPDLAALLAHPWIKGWSDGLFKDRFKFYSQAPYVDDWNLLIAELHKDDHTPSHAVIGYFKNEALKLALPEHRP